MTQERYYKTKPRFALTCALNLHSTGFAQGQYQKLRLFKLQTDNQQTKRRNAQVYLRIIATNQPSGNNEVLVAFTIRSSVLFYSVLQYEDVDFCESFNFRKFLPQSNSAKRNRLILQIKIYKNIQTLETAFEMQNMFFNTFVLALFFLLQAVVNSLRNCCIATEIVLC